MSKGIKFDGSKPDYSLVPPNALARLVDVLTFGAKKYDRHNWRKLDQAKTRYFSAAMRHMWALLRGEKFDPETGIHHAAHALACLFFYIEYDYVHGNFPAGHKDEEKPENWCKINDETENLA